MSIVSDFDDIARRMNRKPEKVSALDNSAAAAVKTLQSLGYTYEDGAQMWKPPVAVPSGQPTMTGNANYNNALFGALKAKSGVSSAAVSKAELGYQMMMADLASGRIRSIND